MAVTPRLIKYLLQFLMKHLACATVVRRVTFHIIHIIHRWLLFFGSAPRSASFYPAFSASPYISLHRIPVYSKFQQLCSRPLTQLAYHLFMYLPWMAVFTLFWF